MDNKTAKEENVNESKSLNFIQQIIEEDLKNNVNDGRVHTRFPPEPNGYLHIGHAKSICLNFSLAQQYQGKCNLRFDDTNPVKEDTEYVNSIMEDIKWLGFQWDGEPLYTSNYFDQLYEWAVKLIQDGKAYIDDQTAEQISEQKKSPSEAGIESPYRSRSVAENLDLFERMKNGEFKDGEKVLRAKIDMASPNMHMRDPIMYRIMHATHHRTGDKWCIYPMYDYAHGESDYIEGITHSICTLEFEVHRPLYEWFVKNLTNTDYRPKQREFARLNLSYTVMSKRKLLELVTDHHVNGWDDPRMPTVSGLRRRGFTPASIRNFADIIGVAKRNNVIDVSLLEHCVREDLNKTAPRVMGVLNPVKLIIVNYPEDKEEFLNIENNPEDLESGSREIPFSRELFIEREDFMEDAPRKFFRMTPGREVRLKAGYIVMCEKAVKDADGTITEIHCTYDPKSKSGSGTEECKRKVKGTLHWVSAKHALKAEVRLYDRLFNDEAPDGHKETDFKEFINLDSLSILDTCYVEPSLQTAKPEDHFQFQRIGYFSLDKDSSAEKLIFNRTVSLKDSWAKTQKKK
ncbi:glutamine--tRNA ligase/YqeY domain fusion protein [Ancylomarina longa]|uniref:Glutamine--tRNA ligase n=1 Tax=Ancylomarina longa TaxID=2487017 RepID=A0A434AU94_9BACT|nr:glutamine--tRNA ligase/YqeY domain fusion protein [Ancylomarina longa]RUT78028.1 glutamine--tRNA ligase/YqeY domain fusion protein [Ancylomarina longa]